MRRFNLFPANSPQQSSLPQTDGKGHGESRDMALVSYLTDMSQELAELARQGSLPSLEAVFNLAAVEGKRLAGQGQTPSASQPVSQPPAASTK